MARRRRILDAKTGVSVPGGVIVFDPYRGRNRLLIDLKFLAHSLLTFRTSILKRDIVIQDASREQELYRLGPFREQSAIQVMNRMMVEIELDGLDMFLMRRKVDGKQIDPKMVNGVSVRHVEDLVGIERAIWRDRWRRRLGVSRDQPDTT
jgi:hypothetical protein